MQKNSKFIDIKDHLNFWNECKSIYENSFAPQDREKSKRIYRKIQNKSYKMVAFVHNDIIKGFYIVDLVQDFAIITFLAVKKDYRGVGIGSKLCKHAIKLFLGTKKIKYLFIEAEFRQSLLYEKMGFKKLKLDYLAPLFKTKESTKINLLAISKNKKLTQKALKDIISKIFLDGYDLKKNDYRLKTQLQRVPKIVKFTKVEKC